MSIWQIHRQLSEETGQPFPYPNQYSNKNMLRMMGSRTKYRTIKGVKHACDFTIYDASWGCEHCSQPHVHSATIRYRKRVQELQKWTAYDGTPRTHWRTRWEPLTAEFFPCQEVNNAVAIFENFPKADLTPILVESIL